MRNFVTKFNNFTDENIGHATNLLQYLVLFQIYINLNINIHFLSKQVAKLRSYVKITENEPD